MQTNASNDDATANDHHKDSASHRGFSQKVRGILLESQSATSDRLPNIPHKNFKKDSHATAPHRGFNEKAREILLDRKCPGVASSKIKGSEKVRHLL